MDVGNEDIGNTSSSLSSGENRISVQVVTIKQCNYRSVKFCGTSGSEELPTLVLKIKAQRNCKPFL